MTHRVIDVASNLEENIKRWGEALKRDGRKRRLYETIYSKKQRRWTSAQAARALDVKKQVAAALLGALRGDSLLSYVDGSYPHEYEKVQDAQHYKKRILAAARSKVKREAIPTKRSARIEVTHGSIRNRAKAVYLPIERVDQFKPAERISGAKPPTPLPEAKFKAGLKRIFGETREFKDWPGERSDFYTDKLKIRGRRFPAAFALKGPGIRVKKATPAKWGKHGDQIQRLVRSSAQVLFLQFEGEIDESSREQLKMLAQLKAQQENEAIYYGFIADSDSARLRRAFRGAFR